MKSIGNGWRRAQEAQKRKKDAERVRGYWAGNEKTTLTPFQPIGGPLSQNVYPAYYAFSDEPTNWTTWQRIKRALRAL